MPDQFGNPTPEDQRYWLGIKPPLTTAGAARAVSSAVPELEPSGSVFSTGQGAPIPIDTPRAPGVGPGGEVMFPADIVTKARAAPAAAPPPPIPAEPMGPQPATGKPIGGIGSYYEIPAQTTPAAPPEAQAVPRAPAVPREPSLEERYLAEFFGASKPPAGKATGAGGSVGGGASLRDLLGTYKTEARLAGELAGTEAQRAQVHAAGLESLAQREQEEAALESARVEMHRQEYDRRMTHIEDQLTAVQERRVDPNRLMKDTGSKVLAVIGGLFGGVYQGVNKLDKNPFLEDLNRKIEQDIGLQEREIGRAAEGVKGQLNLIGHLRDVFKDEQVARLQARTLFLEGAKTQIESEMARYDSPATLLKGQQGMNIVQRQLDNLKIQLDNAARAGAAAQADKEWNRKVQVLGLIKGARSEDTERMKAEAEMLKAQAAVGEGARDLLGRFVPTGQAGGNPTGYLAGSKEAAAKETAQQKARNELIGEIDKLLAIRAETGVAGRTINRQNPKDAIQLYTPEWQSKVRLREKQLLIKQNQASGLGALDKGSQDVLDQITGNLESRGSESDVRLRELRSMIEDQNKVDTATGGGALVKKVLDEKGHEQIVPLGGQNLPPNQKEVKRTPVGQ